MGNRKSKVSFRISDNSLADLKQVAEYLHMDISECIRNSLRFGLAGLLKFETSGRMTLKKLLNPEEKERLQDAPTNETETSIPKEKLEELCKIAQTKWLTEDNNE